MPMTRVRESRSLQGQVGQRVHRVGHHDDDRAGEYLMTLAMTPFMILALVPMSSSRSCPVCGGFPR